MIRPDTLPIEIARSRAVLGPHEMGALFGAGYRLRGTERVRLPNDVAVVASTGPAPRLVLDALDRQRLGSLAGLYLRGPVGVVPAPEPERVRRALVLPAGLLRAWGLAPGARVTVQAGAVAFGDVTVEEGEPARVRLDAADILAADLPLGATARWRPDLDLELPTAPEPDDHPVGRVVTETDVRQARLRGERIRLRPGQIVTPAARSLGRQLGVFEDDGAQ